MGRKLSSWEKSQRQREHDSQLRRNAERRANERARVREERAREREQIRSEREAEREARLEARELQRQSEISASQELVNSYNQYVHAITTLHLGFDINEMVTQFNDRCQKRVFIGSVFEPRAFRPATFPLPTEPVLPIVPNFGNFYRKWKDRGTHIALNVSIITCALGGYILADTLGFPSLVMWVIITFCVAGVGLTNIVMGLSAHRDYRAHVSAVHQQVRRLKEQFAQSEVERRAKFDAAEKRRYKAFVAEEKERQKQFETEELRLNDAFEANESVRLETLANAQKGNPEALQMLCEAAFPLKLEVPELEDFVSSSVAEYEIAYAIPPTDAVQLLIHLPDEGVIPTRQVTLNASGTSARFKMLSVKERNELYDRFVASFSLCHVLEFLRFFPEIKTVLVESCLVVPDDATGRDREDVVLQCHYDVASLTSLDLERADPLGVLNNFDHQFHSRSGRKKARTESRILRDELIWATPDDDDMDLPYGLVPDETEVRMENCYTE